MIGCERMAQPSDIPGSLCVPEVGLLAALKWNRNSKGQGQIKQKIKDLPALFKNGLNLKKKHADVVIVQFSNLFYIGKRWGRLASQF